MNNTKSYIITGPTSGIGYETALELAKHGNVILVGRSQQKLANVKQAIEASGHQAVTIQCDLSDVKSARKTAEQIIALKLPIAGLLNNAGIMPADAAKNALGWDITFTTNHLGPFAFTEALLTHLPNGANVAFIASAIEDPERKPAKAIGMKGARFISVAASANGEWAPGGSKMAGIDAYATSMLCVLASAMALARENPRLHINAIEPGITRGTNLGGESAPAFVRFLFGQLMAIIPPFSHYASTPKKAAKMITKVLTDNSGATGVYFDEKGQPMRGSVLSQDSKFQERVLSETRVLLQSI
jgi:NAD(P)-dependent dehydrogenase (short-subunit alcohol dehydrogenase family)